MGAPESGMKAAEQPNADALLTSFRTIKDPERLKHVAVLDYWLSIRGDKEFPPLHDLDPLEISDAAPSSILFELLSGGQDAEVRHLGDTLKDDVTVQRIIDAPTPSLLSSIARKLPIVAISRDFLAFEDNFSNADGLTRCWITLLPLSSCGSWVDYVYAFVSVEKASTKAAKPVAEPQPSLDEPPIDEAAAVEDALAEPEALEKTPPEEVAAVEEAAAEPEPVEEDPQGEAAAVEEAVAEPEAVEPDPVELEEPVAEDVDVRVDRSIELTFELDRIRWFHISEVSKAHEEAEEVVQQGRDLLPSLKPCVVLLPPNPLVILVLPRLSGEQSAGPEDC